MQAANMKTRTFITEPRFSILPLANAHPPERSTALATTR
jgi:hypothetical protein